MKNSIVKSIQPNGTWEGKYGLMYKFEIGFENGDKINIGKKKEQKVGWELTYEITEQGQQEYNKAKAVAPESFNKSNNYTPSNSSNDDRQLLIVKQSSIKAAVEFDNQCTIEDMLKNAEIIKDWVMGTDVQKKVDKVAKAFNDKFAGTTPDDLPF